VQLAKFVGNQFDRILLGKLILHQFCRSQGLHPLFIDFSQLFFQAQICLSVIRAKKRVMCNTDEGEVLFR
jgi:hypothetical protein